MAPRAAAALAALLAAGCAGPGRRHFLPPPAQENRAGAPAPGSAGPVPPSSTGVASPEVARALAALSGVVGQRRVVLDGVDYGDGCIALARAAFAEAGKPLPAEAADAGALHALAARAGSVASPRRPAPGDLLFLADRPGGPPEHVAVVARVDADGTALVLDRTARGVARLRVNLAYPGQANDPATGRRINDSVRVGDHERPVGSLVVSLSDLLRRG